MTALAPTRLGLLGRLRQRGHVLGDVVQRRVGDELGDLGPCGALQLVADRGRVVGASSSS